MSTPFLAIDVGNSSTKAARFDGTTWEKPMVIPRDEDVRIQLKSFIEEQIPCGIASVVPKQTQAIQEMWREGLFVVGTDVHLPFAMAYETPETLGADRLAAATGAWRLYGKPENSPVVALTAGTALTLTVIDLRSGEPALLGGAILPGPDLLRRVFGEETAQLPVVDLEVIPPVIGTTTEECLQVGISASLFTAAATTIRRTSETLTSKPIVVATGGWATELSQRTGLVDTVNPNLIFEGIRHLAKCKDNPSKSTH